MKASQLAIVVPLCGLVLPAPIAAQVTQRVSLSARGAQAHAECGEWGLAISGDGRYVAFVSRASNLVPGDTNAREDVFVRDRRSGSTERVSVSSSGTQANRDSYSCSLSADGRYVGFASEATNLVPGDTNGINDAFVHDRLSGITERVSVGANGEQGNYGGGGTILSADGRYALFSSDSTNLAPGGTNSTTQVYVRDRLAGTIERVSVSAGGSAADDESYAGGISADGRFVAFASYAGNLVPGDHNWQLDVFVHDRQTGATERASVSSTGAETDSPYGDIESAGSISADGRYVAFDSHGNNLVPGDTNDTFDVFVHDRVSHRTERVSVDSVGVQGNDWSYAPSISSDGRYVMFTSFADKLVPGDTNQTGDLFVHDRASGSTERVSLSSSGAEGNGLSSFYADIAGDGRHVVFCSEASNLVSGDTNGVPDVFVRDRFGGTSFTGQCDPGLSGVMGCPCSNPPSGNARGCDNSSATGGASLSALGGAFLSSDSLFFNTEGETAAALSILLQGSAVLPSGVVYGQGVRCLGGRVLRLFTKSARAGSITAPRFEAGDSTISARSAALGDVIQPGENRWYLVAYRDPVVLGGCPGSSTFNATQTGVVSWAP